MLHFRETLAIDVPAERTWEVVADHRRDPEWRTGVVEMRRTPTEDLVVGTVTHEVLRLGGRTYRNEGVVTAVVPGQRLEWRTTQGADAHGARAVAPLGPDRCSLTLELHVEPHGADRLLAPLLGRMLARNLRADLRRLAVLLAEPATVPA